MKKLIIEIILLMLVVMGCVVGLSQLVLFIIRTQGILISSTISYYVSLVSGLIGLLLFFLLLNIFFFKRIKKLSEAVTHVKAGEYDRPIKSRGHDEITNLMNDFNQMSEQLKSNEYLSREFVKNVSHEFKTPLSSIIGYADLLKSNSENLTQEQREYLAIIYQQAINLETMSHQMLTISRLDANTNLAPDVIFNPQKQIQTIILSLQNKWQSRNLQWNLELNESDITGQMEMCNIIWRNLISNAIKFADEKTIVNIELKIDRNLQFIISNQGPEIPTAERELIFKQFYMLKNVQNSEGSGLGLPIVSKIVNKLNGSIIVHSDNMFTSFRVQLPYHII